jgi:hypothetical protein
LSLLRSLDPMLAGDAVRERNHSFVEAEWGGRAFAAAPNWRR